VLRQRAGVWLVRLLLLLLLLCVVVFNWCLSQIVFLSQHRRLVVN
jgi:uncharacterized integral membrane protein